MILLRFLAAIALLILLLYIAAFAAVRWNLISVCDEGLTAEECAALEAGGSSD